MRHGAVDNPAQIFYSSDTPLSERGRRQVAMTAERMREAGVMFSSITCSPCTRTRQTAEIVAAVLGGLPIKVDERLREWDVNGWIGKPFEDFYRHVGWLDGAMTTEFPSDIESYPMLAARVEAALHEAITADPERSLIISHGEPIACIAATLQRKPWIEVRMHQIHLADVWRFTGPDASGLWHVDWAFGPSAL